MAKKKVIVETKYTAKGADDVENAYKDIGDSANKASESTDKTNESIKETGKATEGAKKGIGGLLNGFKAIVMNPVGLVLVALVGAIKFVEGALSTSEGASNKLAQGFSYLKGFIVPLQKAVVVAFEFIAEAIQEPGKLWEDFMMSLNNGLDYLQTNFVKPVIAVFSSIGLGVESDILKMRIAWNNFTGDVEESDALKKKLEEVETQLAKNAETVSKALETIANDVTETLDAVSEGVSKYIEEADKLGDALSALTKREQNLLKIRRAQEVQNASSLADIEKLKLIRDNEAKSLDERIEANEKIAEVEKKRVEQSISLFQSELQLTRDRIKLEGDSTELLDIQKDQLIAIQELRNETAGIESEQVVNRTALLTEEFDKRASLIDKESELLAIREKDAVILADAQVQAQMNKLEALRDLGLEEKAIYIETQNALELAQATSIQTRLDADIEASERKKELDLKNSEDAIKLADDTAKQKAEIEQALNNAIINFASSLSTALGEESKSALLIQKTVALAQIGIDTAKAISSLVASSSANPANALTFGGAGAIQFATGLLSIGSNLAQAYSILKQPAPQIGGGSSGGGSAPAPTTTQTAPDLGFEGRSAGSEQFGAQIIRAYVSETDITTSQNNANNIQQISQIG